VILRARGLYDGRTYSGTGYHRLAADQLSRYRAAVVDDHLAEGLTTALAAIKDGGLEIINDSLTAVPPRIPARSCASGVAEVQITACRKPDTR
jgi:hypothetical protein